MQESTMTATLPWWQNGVIYQIYPKSFQDTTGSGTGDLAGVIQRLDYLQTLGVDAIWLTPFYVSPQVDNGYDVADYQAIDPAYGTMGDFDNLVAAAHQRGIRIILDMVFNHTSTEHAWFRAAENPQDPHRDFYIWRDGTPNTPPNGWQAKFGGSAWQWHAASGQHYLHLFAPEQADLNWENPAVRQALQQICHFWADRGVDGLRLDVVNLVSKHPGWPEDIPGGDGRRFYTDGPRIHDFLQEFSREVFAPRQLMTVGEMSSTSLEHCRQYAALDGRELSMTFNFHHLKVDYPNGQKWALAEPDFIELKKIFTWWQQGMHNQAWNALFWCNHDQPRIVSRFGSEGPLREVAAKALALALHGLQGTPYIYQGEELGMTNPHFRTIEEYRDVESLNMFAAGQQRGENEATLLAVLASKSRDNSRTPMQWDSSPHSGFTKGTPWIGVCENYPEINARAAMDNPDSVFYTYQHLIRLRKTHPVITWGDYEDLLPDAPTLWCYRRTWQGRQLVVAINLSPQPQTWAGCALPGTAQVLAANYPHPPLQPEGITLRPFEAVWWQASSD